MHAPAVRQGTLGTLSAVAYKLGLLVPAGDSAARRTASTRPALEIETDPRTVAATLAVAIRQAAGPLTTDCEHALRAEFQRVLGQRQGRNLLAHACRLAADYRDPIAVCDFGARFLKRQLWRSRKQELVDMLARLSNGDPVQVRALGRLKTQLEL